MYIYYLFSFTTFLLRGEQNIKKPKKEFDATSNRPTDTDSLTGD